MLRCVSSLTQARAVIIAHNIERIEAEAGLDDVVIGTYAPCDESYGVYVYAHMHMTWHVCVFCALSSCIHIRLRR